MTDAEFDRLIVMLTEAVQRIETKVRAIPVDRWDDMVQTSDGRWTRRDLLAHVAANDLRQLVRVRAGAGIAEATDTAALAAELRLHEWNQARVDRRRDHDVEQLIAEMRANRAGLLTLLQSLTQEQRDRLMPFRGEPTPLAEMIPTLVDHLDGHTREIAALERSVTAR